MKFPSQPLDESKEKLNYMIRAIRKALKIVNACRVKIKIVFYDTAVLKEVESTVWNSTRENAVLKNGTCIAFYRVVDVK